MIQAIILDYGNVLSRTLDPRPRAHWENRLRLTPGALQRVVHNDHTWVEAQCGRLSVDDYWQNVGQTLNLTSQDIASLRQDFYRGDVRNNDLVTCIDQLRSGGLRTAILSNFSTELRSLLHQQDLQRRFDVIVISAEIGIMKPAIAAYRAVLDQLDLAPECCVFIDDLSTNVEAAHTLGMQGILFRDNASCFVTLDGLLRGCHL